jgi:hypothetical protein
MAPVDQFPFQSRHHFIKIRLYWEAKAKLDPQLSDALALGNPLEANLLAPSPGAFSPARPDGSGFVPVYLGVGCYTKRFQNSLGLN